jgi:hypothetical protein
VASHRTHWLRQELEHHHYENKPDKKYLQTLGLLLSACTRCHGVCAKLKKPRSIDVVEREAAGKGFKRIS